MTEDASRRLPSWISAFVDYTEGLKTPPIFRRWAAISAVAGALEKKVWIQTDQGDIFLNLYVLLVGPPGVGKGEALKNLRIIWSHLEELKVASSTVSHASMLDELKEAHRKIFRPADAHPLTEFHSLQVASTEFSTFLPVYDTIFMSYLQQWYDCEEIPFSESRRGRAKGKDLRTIIKGAQVSLIAGTTPNYLGKLLPEGAWDQGFCARVIPVFSDEVIKIQFWKNNKKNNALLQNLIHDMKLIHETFGRLEWTPEAAEAIQSWVNDGCEPVPSHPRLVNYNTRRPVHILKLCAIMCMSRAGNEMTIAVEDVLTAIRFLTEAEEAMPNIFETMMNSIDSSAINDTLHFIKTEAKKGPVPEHKIVSFIVHHTTTPAYNVMKLLQTMEGSAMIRVLSVGERGRNSYGPV